MFQSNKKAKISSVTQQYLVVVRLMMKYEKSKKLLILLSKRFLISGVILGPVINRPEGLSSKGPGAGLGT